MRRYHGGDTEEIVGKMQLSNEDVFTERVLLREVATNRMFVEEGVLVKKLTAKVELLRRR